MQSEPINRDVMSDRFLCFSVNVIQFCTKLQRTYMGRHIANQLFRSATSSGANYEEAIGAESRADFVHKLQLVLKELRESIYWIKIIQRSPNFSNSDAEALLKEAIELSLIVGKSVLTTKQRS